jgi:hypothetical protein
VFEPGDVKLSELGARLPQPAILQDGTYHPDLAKLVLSAQLPMTRPADRFPAAMWKLRHYIWDVPQGVLELSLTNRVLAPVATADRADQLAAALAHLAAKFETVEEAEWAHERLEQAIKEIMADTTYWAFFETKNAQGNVYQPLRWALLAGERGLPIATTMEILGREETLKRLGVAKAAADTVAVEYPLMPQFEADELTDGIEMRDMTPQPPPEVIPKNPADEDPFYAVVAKSLYDGRKHGEGVPKKKRQAPPTPRREQKKKDDEFPDFMKRPIHVEGK